MIRSSTSWNRRVTPPTAAALLLAAIAACSGGSSEPKCAITSIAVTPASPEIGVGETQTLSASVSSSNCNPEPTVNWSLASSGAVTLVPSGNTATVTGVSPTSSPVTVTATVGSTTGTAQVSVVVPAVISLAPTQLQFFSWEGGPDPLQTSSVDITNSGGGTLSGLSIGSIAYSGGASGWITIASLSSPTASPSAQLQIHVATGGLAGGTYTAQVPVQSSGATNSPQTVAVTFNVSSTNPCAVSSAVPINIGDSVDGTLAQTDCFLNDTTFLDAYVLTVTSQVTLQVDMTSPAFDAFLILLDANLSTIDLNDDRDASTTDAQMTGGYAPGTYYILANSFDANAFGAYNLTITQVAPLAGGARLQGPVRIPASKAAALRRIRR